MNLGTNEQSINILSLFIPRVNIGKQSLLYEIFMAIIDILLV